MKPFPTIVLAAGLASALGGCAATLPPAAFAGGSPEMRPETFFAGGTHADGVLENRSGAPTALVRVRGTGETLPDGAFRLDQTVAFEKGETERRTWILRRRDAHRYLGALTDAAGPVRAEAYGNLFHVLYPMKGLPAAQFEEWMYLQPDGRTVVNECTVFVLGVVAARYVERITHDGG